MSYHKSKSDKSQNTLKIKDLATDHLVQSVVKLYMWESYCSGGQDTRNRNVCVETLQIITANRQEVREH